MSETHHLTDAQRSDIISGLLAKAFPGARSLDIERRTPLGNQIRQARATLARKAFELTGDARWLQFAKEFNPNRYRPDTTAASVRDTK